jgi:lysine-N-methylase
MGQKGYILEHYIVNYVFKTMFPLASEKHCFDNYIMMIVHYAMIKILLIGIAGFYKEKV